MAKTLNDVLHPMPVDAFLNEVWGTRPHHLARGDSRFGSLLSWDELNLILERHRLDHPRLRMSKEGKDLPRDTFLTDQSTRRGVVVPRLNVAGLHAALADGAMLVLDAIDEIVPAIEAVALDMERVLGESAQVNAYAGWKTSQGFSTHWDDHDVIVLQLHGCKDWRVFPQTREFPLYKDIDFDLEAPKGEPLLQLRLQPGDALYIPRGWWHDARPCGEPTLHLTFGVTKRTAIDYVEALAEKLRHDPVFRQDLPRFASREQQDRHLKTMRERLLEAFDRASLAEYFAECDSRAAIRWRPSVPWPSVARSAEEWKARGLSVALLGRRRVVMERVDGDITLKLGGRKLTLARASGPLLDLLVSEEKVNVERLLDVGRSAAISESDVLDLVQELVRLGMVSTQASADPK